MKIASAYLCAFCAALGLAFPASAETETIAYWPFGTNGFHDVSGNGHDLVGVEVAESDAAYMSLNPGTTTNQFLRTATALDLSQETAVTFECWFRQTPAKPAKVTCLLMSSANPSTGTGGFLITNNGRIQAQYRAVEGGWQIDYSDEHPSAWNDGMWHHVGYVVERSRTDHFSCRLYVDGVRQTGGSANPVIAALFNDVFMIGGGSTTYEAGKNYFRGYIDDVRISRGVVAPADFLKYPTVGKTMRADDGKLPVVAYWPFGGKRGKDATGNGFDLTIDNTFPMLSGTPNPQYATRNAWTNFYISSFPFSAFSKAGMTIECFVRSGSAPGDNSSGHMLLESAQWWNSPGAFRFSYEGSNAASASFRRIGISFLAASGKYASSVTTEAEFGAMNDNRWRHVAVVYDPSKTGPGIVQLYVDGIAATDSGTSATQGAFALRDDILKFASGLYGQIDDMRITAGVLTPDQFLTSRSVGSTVALYRFDQSSLADVSGNGTELVLMSGSGTASGSPTFGDGGYPESGTGLVMSGKNASKDWIQTANPIDLTNTKGLTVEFDFNGPQPKAEDNSTVYVMAASSNATTEKGGFVIYRTGDGLQGQVRKDASGWWMPLVYAQDLGTTLNGYHRSRYVIDATTAGKITTSLWADGTRKNGTPQNDSFTSLGNLTLCFGHCPTYYGYSSSEPCYLKGKYVHIAVSDVLLDPADFVLDNLPPAPETKATLAYWDFASLDGLSVAEAPRRGGGLVLNGTTAVTTTNLTLSTLTQATIECFVRFGASPSSGTILSLGSGVGSFAVTSDATTDTLTGTFIPYDHLAASNGGTAALAPLAGKIWHHVALVIDRTKPGSDAVKFYVDYERATPAGRAWDKAATMLDGVLTVGAGFTGRIDDLRVSAGALEPSEFIQSAARTGGPDGASISIR